MGMGLFPSPVHLFSAPKKFLFLSLIFFVFMFCRFILMASLQYLLGNLNVYYYYYYHRFLFR